MTERFNGALQDVQRRMSDSLLTYSVNAMEKLDGIAQAMTGKTIVDTDFLKLMELYGRKYRKIGNEKGCRFCVMRMQQLIWVRQRKKRQKEFPNLVFTGQMDSLTKEFLDGFPAYLHSYEEQYKKNVLRLAVIFTIFLMIFLVLICHLSFLTGWVISMFSFGLILWLTFRDGWQRLIQDQLDDLIHEVEPSCELLNKSIQNDL